MAPSLDQLLGHLLIQCRPAQASAAAEVASANGGGLVITGRAAEPTALMLRDTFTGPILCDADRYSGSRRVGAGRGVTPAWYRRQRELGLIPLSDSGYVAPRNLVGLRSILRATAREPQPAIAMLPLAARWFATSSVCDALASEITMAGVPVAVAIEHAGDPFAVQYVLRGFLRLLYQVDVPVLLLRSDISALGVLCHGAHAAAIGTGSALRHIYPIRASDRRGWRRPAGIATFVTPLLSYHTTDTIRRIVDRTPDHEHLWQCPCQECEGRTPKIATAEGAFRHALGSQLRLRAELFRARTRQALVSTWHEHCSHALNLHEELAGFLQHRPPGALRGWLAVTEDPLAGQRIIPGQLKRNRSRVTL